MRGRAPVGWLGARHSLLTEAAVVLAFYAVYEVCRGLVAGDRADAVRHGQTIASVERSLHVFVEENVQHEVGRLPGVLGVLGILYLTLHLSATGGYLLWLHARRPAAFALVRTSLLVASALAVVGYLAFPAAPPRLAGLGISDTISNGQVDLNHGLVSALYNPYAAFPSVHVAFATIVGASLVRHGAGPVIRAAGVVYPALVLLVIVATGNHFLVDAFAGAIVAATAGAAARLVVSARAAAWASGAPGRPARAGGGSLPEPAGYRLTARDCGEDVAVLR